MNEIKFHMIPDVRFGINARNELGEELWALVRQDYMDASKWKCVYCFSEAEELHEEWRFDIEGKKATQVLVRLLPLCEMCHRCVHILRSSAVSDEVEYDAVVQHLMYVNKWGTQQAHEKIKDAIDTYYDLRNKLKVVTEWHMNYSILLPAIKRARQFAKAMKKVRQEHGSWQRRV